MEKANRHTDALQLPIEVWNKVFACLERKFKLFDDGKVDDVTEQAQLHQLRLVCTKSLNSTLSSWTSCYCQFTCPSSPDPAFYAGCSGTEAMLVLSCHSATLTARPFFLALSLALPLS